MEKEKLIKKTSEQLYKSQKNEYGKEYTMKVHGKKFLVFPNVFSPKYFGDSEFFSQWIPVMGNGSFLEIGCGVGVNAIFAAFRGAKKVVATDINPNAVLNTVENVNLHGLRETINVREGDLFDPVQGEKFDSIFWNVPFLYTDRSDLTSLEKATFDCGDTSKVRFIEEAKKYLTVNGKLYIGYSSNYGDMEKMFNLLKKNNYSAKIIAQTKQIFASGIINLELIEAVPNS